MRSGCGERRHKIPQNTTTVVSVNGGIVGHAKALAACRSCRSRRSFGRRELLTLVPHSMSTIDRLEAEGKFPKRIRLEPTIRVAWLRREVTAILAPSR